MLSKFRKNISMTKHDYLAVVMPYLEVQYYRSSKEGRIAFYKDLVGFSPVEIESALQFDIDKYNRWVFYNRDSGRELCIHRFFSRHSRSSYGWPDSKNKIIIGKEVTDPEHAEMISKYGQMMCDELNTKEGLVELPDTIVMPRVAPMRG